MTLTELRMCKINILTPPDAVTTANVNQSGLMTTHVIVRMGTSLMRMLEVVCLNTLNVRAF